MYNSVKTVYKVAEFDVWGEVPLALCVPDD